MIMKLLEPSNQLLTTDLETFDFDNPPTDPKELAEKMLENLVHHRGVGLSANQIGLPYRVFVMHTEPEKLVCFNPIVTWESEEMSVLTEGCLTYPSLYVKIRRPEKIRAKFFDENGEMKTTRMEGLLARCYQHELDHLDGKNYLDRASRYHLDAAKKKMKHLNRKIKKFEKLGELYGN